MKHYLPKQSELPQILTCRDGSRVTTVEQWEGKRRGELYDFFADNVYGRMPKVEAEVSHTLEREEADAAIEYRIVITTKTKFGSHSFNGYLSVPKADQPCPVFELIQFPDQATHVFKEKLLKRGYALARFYYPEVCTDDNNDFSGGLHAVVKEPDGVRKDNTWGAIASWAWAASRLMDVVETIPEIDAGRAAIVGHSRTGKAALWCGASDPRFGLVCSNESGCGGTAITRGKLGEHIKDICKGFPCWFCSNYRAFGADEEKMPFDQHMLLSLIAPRALYVPSAVEDLWSGPSSEFLSAKYAGEIYALYGEKPLCLEAFPIVGTVDQSGKIAYHLRRGAHALSPYEWDEFINYADKVL